MSVYASIKDVYIKESSDIVTEDLLEKEPKLDPLEYCMGLKRGDIELYKDSSLRQFEVHEDIRDLMRAHLLLLMPDENILRKILELFNWNHENGPSKRRKFTDVIPPQEEYEYQVFCIKKNTPALIVDGKRHRSPFRQLPHVRCSVHPCFIVPSTIRFYVNTYILTGTGGKLEETERLSQTLNLVLARSIYMSWFDGTKTTRDFPGRPIPFGRRDPPPKELDEVPTEALSIGKVSPSQAKKVPMKGNPVPTVPKAEAAEMALSCSTNRRKRKLPDLSASSGDDPAPVARRRRPRFTS